MEAVERDDGELCGFVARLRGDGLDGVDQVVCIVEARPGQVTPALDVNAYPGVPTLTVTADELASGRWHLQRT